MFRAAQKKMGGKGRLGSVLCPTRRYRGFLYFPRFPIPSDISLSSVRTPKFFLLAATPNSGSQLLKWLHRDRDTEQHHTYDKAQSLGSLVVLIFPFHPHTTQRPQQLWPTWLPTDKHQHRFRAFSPPDFFQKSAVPTQPLQFPRSASGSYHAIDIQEILFRSLHGHGCGAEPSLSDHFLVCLTAEQDLNSLCTNWLRKPWLNPQSWNTRQCRATRANFLLLFSRVSIYVSICAFCTPLFIPKLSVLWPWEINMQNKHLRAAERRKPNQNKTFINLSLMYLFPFPCP